MNTVIIVTVSIKVTFSPTFSLVKASPIKVSQLKQFP